MFGFNLQLVKLIEDFEMAADSDLGARPAVSEAAGVTGAGMCPGNRRLINLPWNMHLK